MVEKSSFEIADDLINSLKNIGVIINESLGNITCLLPKPSSTVFSIKSESAEVGDFNLIINHDKSYLDLIYFKKGSFKKECLYSFKSNNAYTKELNELPGSLAVKARKLFDYIIKFTIGKVKFLPEEFSF